SKYAVHGAYRVRSPQSAAGDRNARGSEHSRSAGGGKAKRCRERPRAGEGSRMLNLVWVRTFLALIESGSFQGAAAQLKLAQPTVSQQLRKLEELLGVRLVQRSRSGCEPTRAALEFLPYAQSLVRINQRAFAAIRGDHLRVGASSNVGIYLLQPYIR